MPSVSSHSSSSSASSRSPSSDSRSSYSGSRSSDSGSEASGSRSGSRSGSGSEGSRSRSGSSSSRSQSGSSVSRSEGSGSRSGGASASRSEGSISEGSGSEGSSSGPWSEGSRSGSSRSAGSGSENDPTASTPFSPAHANNDDEPNITTRSPSPSDNGDDPKTTTTSPTPSFPLPENNVDDNNNSLRSIDEQQHQQPDSPTKSTNSITGSASKRDYNLENKSWRSMDFADYASSKFKKKHPPKTQGEMSSNPTRPQQSDQHKTENNDNDSSKQPSGTGTDVSSSTTGSSGHHLEVYNEGDGPENDITSEKDSMKMKRILNDSSRDQRHTGDTKDGKNDSGSRGSRDIEKQSDGDGDKSEGTGPSGGRASSGSRSRSKSGSSSPSSHRSPTSKPSPPISQRYGSGDPSYHTLSSKSDPPDSHSGSLDDEPGHEASGRPGSASQEVELIVEGSVKESSVLLDSETRQSPNFPADNENTLNAIQDLNASARGMSILQRLEERQNTRQSETSSPVPRTRKQTWGDGEQRTSSPKSMLQGQANDSQKLILEGKTQIQDVSMANSSVGGKNEETGEKFTNKPTKDNEKQQNEAISTSSPPNGPLDEGTKKDVPPESTTWGWTEGSRKEKKDLLGNVVYDMESWKHKPPALSTYGESKYIPSGGPQEKQDPDAAEPVGGLAQRYTPAVRSTPPGSPAKNAKQAEFNLPPLPSEIAITPPPDDESTLGTEGVYLERFPKRKKNQQKTESPSAISSGVAGELLSKVPTTMNQEDAKDDYFKSWIRPKGREAIPYERTDPPGNVNLFPFNPTTQNRAEFAPQVLPPKPLYTGINKDALSNSKSWVPAGKNDNGPQMSNVRVVPLYFKSDSSTTSNWAPPGAARSKTVEEVDLESKRTYIAAIMAKSRPGRTKESRSKIERPNAARIDFTGAVNPSSLPFEASPSSATPSSSSSSKLSTSVSRSHEVSSSRSEPSESSASKSNASSSSKSRKPGSSRFSRFTRNHDENSGVSESTSDSSPHGILSPASLLGSPGNSSSSESFTIQVEDSEKSFSLQVVDDSGGSPRNKVAPVPPIASYRQGSAVPSPLPLPKRTTARFSTTKLIILGVCIFLILGAIGVAVVFVVLEFDGSFGRSNPQPASTSAPTTMETIDTSIQGLQNLIVSVSPGTSAALNDPNSPQRSALNWLAENRFIATYSREQVLQRFVLATLYYSTNGPSWLRDDVWLTDVSECDWYSSETKVATCNAQGLIDEIDLDNNNLSGELPWTELAIMKHQLLVLDVFANQITGSLSTYIGQLTSLGALDLQENLFVGSIPSDIEQLTTLKHLLLSGNSLSGTFPIEITRMTNLETLRLSRNSFRGSIPPQLGSLTNLMTLFLEENNFSGTIPSELCNSNLNTLVIDCESVSCDCCECGNDIAFPSGPPVELSTPEEGSPSGPPVGTPTDGGNLSSLIADAFPQGQSALQDPNSPQSMALQWLESSANDDISTVESYLQRYALATLYYSTNGNEWKDRTAWLSNTNECSWISTASSLGVCDQFGRYIELDLQDNNLQGTLPPELALLAETLQTINLRGNAISGAFPTFVDDFVNLEILELSSNSITGPISPGLFSLKNLKRLSLFENKLLSTISSEIGQLTGLELLDVGSNQMTGTIPTTIGRLGRLAGLSVFGNLFTGTLPVEIGDLQSLQLLYVDSNDFRAPLPTDICLLSLDEFWSDCEEIQCVCCTTCCSDDFGCFAT